MTQSYDGQRPAQSQSAEADYPYGAQTQGDSPASSNAAPDFVVEGRGGPGYDEPYGSPSAAPQTNVLAIVGFVLSFIFWPGGLGLSIAGLVRSKKMAGAGRKLSIAGIIISVLGAIFAILLISSVALASSSGTGTFS